MACVTERGRTILMLNAVRDAGDRGAAHVLIRESLPSSVSALLSEPEVEALRERLAALPKPPGAPVSAATMSSERSVVFLLVFLSTLPVVIPFLLMHDALDRPARVTRHRAGDAGCRRVVAWRTCRAPGGMGRATMGVGLGWRVSRWCWRVRVRFDRCCTRLGCPHTIARGCGPISPPGSRSRPTCCRRHRRRLARRPASAGRALRVSLRRAGLLAVLQLAAHGDHRHLGDLAAGRRIARRACRRRPRPLRGARGVHGADGGRDGLHRLAGARRRDRRLHLRDGARRLQVRRRASTSRARSFRSCSGSRQPRRLLGAHGHFLPGWATRTRSRWRVGVAALACWCSGSVR